MSRAVTTMVLIATTRCTTWSSRWWWSPESLKAGSAILSRYSSSTRRNAVILSR